MKKIFAVIAVLAVVICGAFVLSACGGEDTHKPHTHTADSYEITQQATCTEDGERAGVCKVCGKSFTEVIPATGHDWHLQSEKAATCTETGEQVYACANCFITDERTINALGHDGSVVIPAVPAGCVDRGRTEGKRCSRCDEIIVAPEEIAALGHEFYYEKRSNDTHAIYCENCNYSEIAECEFTEVVIAATCTEDGKLIHTCNVCGDSHVHDTTPALGHQMTTNKTFYKTVDGVYKHRQTCYRCEYYVEENCTAGVKNIVNPACESIGYTVYQCDGCGNIYNSDFTDALGHDWSPYVLEDNGGNPYEHTHTRHCQRDDCTEREQGVKVGVVGTVIGIRTDETCEDNAFTEYTCSIATCEYAYTENYTGTALGHSYGDWVYSGDNDEHHTHTHYCLRTGCDKQETSDCRMVSSSQAATCTKPAVEVDVCQDCFHVDRDESPALGHTWSNWISISAGGNLQHTHICTVCSLREYGNHSLETTTTPADCEHDEAIVNTCSICGYTTGTAIAGTALGHEWVVVDFDSTTHSLVCNRYATPHEVTAPHDHSHSNLCAFCRYDGLTYELAVSGEYFIVKNDNGVPRASEITVAAFLPNPAYYDGSDLPETLPVRSIGGSAFYRNTVLNRVLLPATITAIESNAFDECTALTSVEYYGGASQLTRIESGAFYNCVALSAIELSSTLRIIGSNVFFGCVALDDIAIPESVAEIGYRAFYNTAFFNDDKKWIGGALYAGLHLIGVRNSYFTDDNSEFAIKPNTIAVAEFAFDGCAGMTKLTIPVSVKTIGTDAFRNCTGLKEVVYGGSVADWFAITFVSTLSSPMYYATSMNITGEISPNLVLPENITYIPAGTFKGNTNIVSVTIPAKVTSIGDEAFMNCTNLADITFESDNVSYMGKDAFTGTAFYKDGGNWEEGVLILENHILATDDGFDKTEYVIAENIRTISPGAFADCTIETLTIGEGVVWWGADAFNVAALKNVTFANMTNKWFAKNAGGALRSVSATDSPTSNAQLLKYYPGEWRKV